MYVDQSKSDVDQSKSDVDQSKSDVDQSKSDVESLCLRRTGLFATGLLQGKQRPQQVRFVPNAMDH